MSSTDRSIATTSSAVTASAKKKGRRRRGKRTHRKDDSPTTSDWDISAEARGRSEDSILLAKRRRRTNSVGAPPAPRNTTQFLLEDIACRVNEEKRRTRSASLDDAHGDNADLDADECSSNSDGGASGSMVSREDEEKERALEQEFEDDYREAAYDNYSKMDHKKLASRMVEMERSCEKVSRALQREQEKTARLAAERNRANELAQSAFAQLEHTPPPPPPTNNHPTPPPMASPRA